MSYPANIRRCQHIKVNGTQCGSPALREKECCYFHMRWRQMSMDINMNYNVRGTVTLPTLEDANSIQVGLAEVMRLLVTNQIDHRTAALLLHALRTASANVKLTSLEPKLPTMVVIDPECVEKRPIGATAWSMVEGREFDEVEKDDVGEKDDEGGECSPDLMRLIDGVARDPGFLDRRAGDLGGKQKEGLVEN